MEILPLALLLTGGSEMQIRLTSAVAELAVDDYRWQVQRSQLDTVQQRRLEVFTVLCEKIPALLRMFKVHLASVHTSKDAKWQGPLVMLSTEVGAVLFSLFVLLNTSSFYRFLRRKT